MRSYAASGRMIATVVVVAVLLAVAWMVFSVFWPALANNQKTSRFEVVSLVGITLAIMVFLDSTDDGHADRAKILVATPVSHFVGNYDIARSPTDQAFLQ
jgi:hypothetical protein